MKTITITAQTKETIVDAVRRAIKNANANSKNVNLDFHGSVVTVAPESDLKNIIAEVKLLDNLSRIKQLTGKA